MRGLVLALLWGCTPPTDSDTAPAAVDWRPGLPPLERGLRTITHLHSPWSHDACDGMPSVDGQPNQPCLDDLRAGLCTAGIDVAFLSDHPNLAASQPFEDLFHIRAGDRRDGRANVITCDDGRKVRWYAGIEDDLMPFALERHIPGDAAARDQQYNRDDGEAVGILLETGASVFMSHTEGRDLDRLMMQQDAGLTGVEIFNLHAMFAPNIRRDDLGLDGIGWINEVGPFTSPDSNAEPDLFVLGVLAMQPPSLRKFDALNARGPIVGIVGTDAHQNVLPIVLRDGDRGDSYRRMLRWMSNTLLPKPDETPEQALAAGHSYVAFEILGTPSGFDFTAADAVMGGTTSTDVLTISCPTLHPLTPRGPEDPEILVRLMRDGVETAVGCGEHTVGPGVYRVEVFITPLHLRRFLGDDPEPWLQPFPWILSNPIRVE